MGDGSTKCCMYIGGFLIFAMIITSPIVGVLVVKPALRAARFRSANCTNTYYQRVDSYEGCSCGDECSSSFPCYKVYVDYEDVKHGVIVMGKVVHENEQTLIHHSSCTFDLSSCDSSRGSNERTIQRKLASDGRPGRMYSCYYDPQDHSDVIMSKKFSLTGAINALFWPNFLFLVGVVLIVGGCLCKDGSDECCSRCCGCLKYLFCIPLWAALWERISSCGEMSSSSNNQPVSLQGVNQWRQRRSDNHSNSEELTDEQILEREKKNAPPPNYSQTVLDDDAPPSYNDALRI